MCGIAGIVGGEPRPWGAVVGAMTHALAHRGPDGHGFAILNPGPGAGASAPLAQPPAVPCHGVFGHRRLSVIDPHGTPQPLANEDGAVQVVFNGEIYNYRELRHSLAARGHRLRHAGDTEVLVHLWEEYGQGMTEHLLGMFAFALYDARRGELFLARDRYGQKPLFYWPNHGWLAFASELQGLWQVPGFPHESLDPVAAAQYFRYGYIPHPRTIHPGVLSLPPGHQLLWTVGGGLATAAPYWQPRVREVAGVAGEGDVLERLQGALDEAVRSQMIADVPLGAFLSGGIDSTLLVAAMARHTAQPVHTFTIATGGWCDESAMAERVAGLLGCCHHARRVTPDLVAVSSRLSAHYGQPFADFSSVPTHLVSRFARERVTVALSGDGGDEQFAGYERYLHQRLAQWAGWLPLPLRLALAAAMRRLPSPAGGGRGGFWSRAGDFLASAGPVAERGENLSTTFHRGWRRALCTPELAALEQGAAEGEVARFSALLAAGASSDPLERWLEADQRMYLCDAILTKVDIAAMAVGLETRAPFLDHRFAQLANGLPVALKLAGGEAKVALRQLNARRLPAEVSRLPKKGFTLPLGAWLRGELREWGRATLLDAPDWGRFLRVEGVERLWRAHQAGREDHTMRLWQLLAWNLWRQAQRAHRSRPAGDYQR